jgi:hypothetical protein
MISGPPAHLFAKLVAKIQQKFAGVIRVFDYGANKRVSSHYLMNP